MNRLRGTIERDSYLKRTDKKLLTKIFGIFLTLVQLSAYSQEVSLRVIAKNTLESVVTVVMQDSFGNETKIGSGFVVKDGLIATNYHVVSDSYSGFIQSNNSREKYPISGYTAVSREMDLAVISVENLLLKPLKVLGATELEIGDSVYAAGSPRGLTGTFSDGIVSSFRMLGSTSHIQITAPVSPGSSGGPLVNSRGQVVGIINASRKDAQNANFAIPGDYLNGLLLTSQMVLPISELTEASNSGDSKYARGGKKTIDNPLPTGYKSVDWNDSTGETRIINSSKVTVVKAKPKRPTNDVESVDKDQPIPYADGRFIDLRNGTVYDTKTRLLWQKKHSEAHKNPRKRMDRSSYANRMNREKVGGKSKWRIPTVVEFKSLELLEFRGGNLPFSRIPDGETSYWCFDAKMKLQSFYWRYADLEPNPYASETRPIRLVTGPLDLPSE